MDEKSAIQILRKYAASERDFDKVLIHSRAVQKLALDVAQRISEQNNHIKIDMEFIKTASLLHDIGRFSHPPGKETIKHGVAGADILRNEGIDERYIRVCERHLGAGIPKADILKNNLPLPPKDYLPETIEEKIITYADNLLWGDKPKDSPTVIKRFTDELGENAGRRVKKLHDEIEDMMQGR
ncbi:HDIG domain-containing protein [Candidatus Woesearchaeota archaeon]|nr:HDIG domain-containing protein [Candidatus Woesearchaeota archaeon]